MSNQAQPSSEETVQQEAANESGQEAANETDMPSPDSPEGKARAGRLYFALIVILFIFLGTLIGVYQLGENVFEKIPFTKITVFQTGAAGAPADVAPEAGGEAPAAITPEAGGAVPSPAEAMQAIEEAVETKAQEAETLSIEIEEEIESGLSEDMPPTPANP